MQENMITKLFIEKYCAKILKGVVLNVSVVFKLNNINIVVTHLLLNSGNA